MKELDPVSRLKALADPTRLRILALLGEEELSVGELTTILGMTQSRVSGHLAVLRDAELVRDRRQGTSAFYSLDAEGASRVTWDAVRAIDLGSTAASASGNMGVPRSSRHKSVPALPNRRCNR